MLYFKIMQYPPSPLTLKPCNNLNYGSNICLHALLKYSAMHLKPLQYGMNDFFTALVHRFEMEVSVSALNLNIQWLICDVRLIGMMKMYFKCIAL